MRGIICINLILLAFIFANCQQKNEKPTKTSKKNGVQREAFDAKKYPNLTAIGRISFSVKKQCSLILVSEDIAITAGHCFLEKTNLSDMSKDFNPTVATVTFRVNGVKRIKDLYVKRVLKAKMEPDYAIVRLNRKIDSNLIKPLKFEKLTLHKMRAKEKNLGCAGFNGDKKLGDGGFTMTISRNIKIIPESSSKNRIDANCISTHGGSGGAFFEEKQNDKTDSNEIVLLGVIWGVTDDSFNEQGDFIKGKESITSITPVNVFFNELTELLAKEK